MKRIESYIQNEYANLKSDQVFVACSGGVDSMVLLHVLNKMKFDPIALHMNYQLRGLESNEDAQFVQDYCEENDIQFEINIVDLPKGNIQEKARNARYQWFKTKLNTTNSCIAVGHHLDDQIETFYLNLARKSGVMGMACMLERNKNLIRPLLSFNRKEIVEYAELENLKWREDSSNRSNKYNRNKLRNEIIPVLKEKIPTLESSIQLMIQHFQTLQCSLETRVGSIKNEIEETLFLKDDSLNQLNALEQNELFRSLSMSNNALESILKLKQKGTYYAFTSHDTFTKVIREKDGFSFKKKSEFNGLPELIVEHVQALPTDYDKQAIFLDATKIIGRLTVRTWGMGDRIKPIGLQGSSLISDIITDAKIPSAERENILVVTDEENIHWCPGLKIGRLAIANQNTKEILKLSISQAAQ